MKRFTTPLFAAVLGGLAAMHAGAQPQLAYLSDNVLNELRGRYIETGNGNITFFGIQLASIWQGTVGAPQGVAVVLQGQPGYKPTMTTYKLDNTSQSGAGSGFKTPQGIATVQGVAQASQISGSRNNIVNQATITINPGNQSADPLPGGNWQLSNGAGVTVGDNRLILQLDQGSAGRLSQTVGQGQVNQYARIDADRTAAQNYLNIQVGIEPNLAGQRGNFSNTLQMLKGLQQMR